jgi:LmbE family N-acetylglucosaminyl deacetylase
LKSKSHKTVAIIVAHPDDETLWAGGTILSHPSWKCFVVCLCRRNDADRSSKFYKALEILKSEGIMGDIDDGPEQVPLDITALEREILNLLPPGHFDLIITHNPMGEYTRHIRHEETGNAVINLWQAYKISTKELWIFAYEDGNKAYYPKPVENATVYHKLTKRIWLRKYGIMTQIYGFGENSWEAKATAMTEAFWQFTNSYTARQQVGNLKNHP